MLRKVVGRARRSLTALIPSLGESLQIVVQKPREVREHVLYGSPKELTDCRLVLYLRTRTPTDSASQHWEQAAIQLGEADPSNWRP